MGEEAFDELELCSVSSPDDTRTLVIRGGYSRDEVYVGICRSVDDHPDELIAVDGMELRDWLNQINIGHPDCKACDGRGWVVVDCDTTNEVIQGQDECEACGGTGHEPSELRVTAEGFVDAVDRLVEELESRGKGVMRAPYHGPFAGIKPSTYVDLVWWSNRFKECL